MGSKILGLGFKVWDLGCRRLIRILGLEFTVH